jgi:ABC-2 type transport system ATP-binding protein
MINFQNLSKSFGKTLVLDKLDLRIDTGDRIALIGSNGAGKTTLIRCLLGEYVCEGTVEVGGKNPREHRTEVLRQISFVPQLPPPLKMPVAELLRYSAQICGAPESEMRQIGTLMGLDFKEIGNRPFFKLSGGQKQKILIAIAMGRPASIIILDEPTANLDPQARQILFDLMNERLDHTMIISSHRLEEVAPLVNRVVEMDRGKVVLDDRVEDVADPSARLRVVLGLKRADEAFAKTANEWGLSVRKNKTEWFGEIPGPDRLQFLGMLTRYAGVLSQIKIEEKSSKGETS